MLTCLLQALAALSCAVSLADAAGLALHVGVFLLSFKLVFASLPTLTTSLTIQCFRNTWESTRARLHLCVVHNPASGLPRTTHYLMRPHAICSLPCCAIASTIHSTQCFLMHHDVETPSRMHACTECLCDAQRLPLCCTFKVGYNCIQHCSWELRNYIDGGMGKE